MAHSKSSIRGFSMYTRLNASSLREVAKVGFSIVGGTGFGWGVVLGF